MSVGGAVIEPRGMPASREVINALIRSADEAMYKAKRQPGHHVQMVYDLSGSEPSREAV